MNPSFIPIDHVRETFVRETYACETCVYETHVCDVVIADGAVQLLFIIRRLFLRLLLVLRCIE
ncbi:hypothetical protein TERTU_3799 [Teredinibacter turnerae T7901]|uniref:Uncharacterized protein n=1 Tax=Teredinibacter turnerae (strain ATCC 39867 / T7901) TaxID=377629 RepID=C5BSV4_TERTT|nr:hypothetical protein TERTU_3799 [Teredinibacter turnerae T7901]